MSKPSDIGCSSGLSHYIFPEFFQFCVRQLAIASVLALAIPSRPAHAFSDFQLCTAQLVRLAGVSPEDATSACSDVLKPQDLSRCVVTMHQITPTLTQDALVACRRVRRPVELSRCVFDISDNTRDSQPTAVLDYCRRSLLPLRYSQCVVGISRETDFSASKVLETCIKAEDFPRDLSPTFAPPPPQIPTPPVNVPAIPSVPVNPVTPAMPINPVNP